MPVRLRRPTASEAARLHALGQDPSVAPWIAPAPTGNFLAVLDWRMPTPRAPRLVGFVHLDLLDYAGTIVGAFDIALFPACRGQGLGLATVRAAEAALARQDVRRVCLGVHTDNIPAQRLYARAGYEQKMRIQAPDGAPAWLLERDLGLTSR